ncbi:hypothetical protein VTN02DRAFT_3121 [Thermoascus thermophilus]
MQDRDTKRLAGYALQKSTSQHRNIRKIREYFMIGLHGVPSVLEQVSNSTCSKETCYGDYTCMISMLK